MKTAKTKFVGHNAFAQEQRADKSLESWFKLAEQGDKRFAIENGILFKLAPEWKTDTHSKLLVLPTCHRLDVVKMAHDSPWSGHQGKRKVLERISKCFAYPGIEKQGRR